MPREIAPPPLVQYCDIHTYTPKYGDYVIWSKWFTTWHGVVIASDDDNVSVIFGGLPRLLFTMDPANFEKNTFKIPLGDLRDSVPGKWAIMRHDEQSNSNVWFV